MNLRAAITAFVVLSSLTLPAYADDQSEWAAARQKTFVQWTKTHPAVAAKIAALKAKTASAFHDLAPLDPSAIDRQPAIFRTKGAPIALWDDPAAPEMVVIPAGEYTMGSPAGEPDRKDREGPLHRVRIGYPFAVGKYDVTVGEFARFVAETGHDTGDHCYTFEDGKMANRAVRSWRNPAFAQAPNEPVICVNWNDAQAYAAWLSKKTGHLYRLLSESEAEYANRAGTTTVFWWGDDIGRNHANCDGCGSVWDNKKTSPVGSFPANPFGLFDTAGNVWSIGEDCWSENYDGAPTDGSASLSGRCDERLLRGGSWNFKPKTLRSASRDGRSDYLDRSIFNSFRLARTL